MDVNPIAIAVPFFFVLIGAELILARLQGTRVYRFADAITDLSCGISSQVGGIFVKVVTVLPYIWFYDHLALLPLDGSWWGTHLIAFLGVDFLYYWWHRWTHEVNLGWATHVVHHQSQDYNLAVALRQSLTSSISSAPFYLPLAVIGLPPWVFFIHTALNTLGQFWIHTETIRKCGPLEWVLNTPSHHRVHHGINPRYLDKNYAGVLIVWDRIFGSFEPETEEVVYGTVKPLDSFNPLWANLWYFWLLAKDSAGAGSVGDALRVWIKHPGWRPEGLPPYPVAQEITREKQDKYAPHVSSSLVAYVIAHFVPVGVAMVGMLLLSDSGLWGVLTVLVSLIFWANLSWGGLFERKRWAIPSELGRLVATGVVATVALVGSSWSVAILPVWAGVLASIGFVLWWSREGGPVAA